MLLLFSLCLVCRASRAEAEVADAHQQAEWHRLRIAELEQTSSVGQLMRRYEAEVQRLRTQHAAELHALRDDLARARKQPAALQPQQAQQAQQPTASTAPSQAASTPPGLDSAAWAALFEEPSGSPLAAVAELRDACMQTEQAQQEQMQHATGPGLLEAARLEIERLQQLNSGLLASHAQGEAPARAACCSPSCTFGSPIDCRSCNALKFLT